MTLGATFHSIDRQSSESRKADFKHQYLNPKVGIIWHPLSSTTLRAAWFKTVKRPFASGQTLEPTHVAGFNQFFDDSDDSRTQRYGVALNQALLRQLRGGVEFSWRDLDVPDFLFGIDPRILHVSQKEEAHRGYLYWTPTDRLALSAEYFFENFEREPRSNVRGGTPLRVITRRVPLSLSYHHPKGFFIRMVASYINQDVLLKGNDDSDTVGDDQFWLVDTSIGYRLPKRWGIVTFGIKNLLDDKFHFQDINFNFDEEPLPPLFVPERVIFTQVTLAF
jgi:outer membrane receptor protein involved in Fe transport